MINTLMENREAFEPIVEYPEIAGEILLMAETDQSMRAATMDDESKWEPEVDRQNTKRLKEIVEEIGWPTISKVGETGSKKAWLLVQHADEDLDFQKHCLELMQEALEDDIDIKNIAYLEDRIRVSEKKPQLYGTQFFTNPDLDEYIPYPIEHPETVDERRTKLGMEPLAEYTERINQQYKK
jgi:hypothetical protein